MLTHWGEGVHPADEQRERFLETEPLGRLGGCGEAAEGLGYHRALASNAAAGPGGDSGAQARRAGCWRAAARCTEVRPEGASAGAAGPVLSHLEKLPQPPSPRRPGSGGQPSASCEARPLRRECSAEGPETASVCYQ